MLSGEFENCYGLKEFILKNVNFSLSNKAVIYAPNGAMKTSFTKTLEAVRGGNLPVDRIFPRKAQFKINYRGINVTHESVEEELKRLQIYVVHSFDENFKSDSISTLLVDRKLKEEYDKIYDVLEKSITGFEKSLNLRSKVPKKSIKHTLISDFGLSSNSEWGDIFSKVNEELNDFEYKSNFDKISYSSVISGKTEGILKDPLFKINIDKYIDVLDGLIQKSNVLGKGFDDHNVTELSKSFKKNDLFKAKHEVKLKDGTSVKTVKEWEDKLTKELKELETSPELNTMFNRIGKQLNANAEAQSLKHLLKENRFLVKYLSNIDDLKKTIWLNYIAEDKKEFDTLYGKFSKHEARIKEIYIEANRERESWERIVTEFNERFLVPFKIRIKNQANILLKDEAPNVVFVYTQGGDEIEKTQTDLMQVLSMGEKRALYLLHVLFDVEMIKKTLSASPSHWLVVADDIADSFDYKNKYAIVEYLKDISDVQYIDLLIMTHNFDFYRTAASRLDIKRENSFIIQRDTADRLIMSLGGYRKDVFKYHVVKGIASGKINNDLDKKKWLIASIPFLRNLAEYQGKEAVYHTLTNLLHIKQATDSITIKSLWEQFEAILNADQLLIDDENKIVLNLTFELAEAICNNITEDIHLENKIILSIAIRLKAEIFMKGRFVSLGKPLPESTSNQTREWYSAIRNDLSSIEKKVLEQVNIMTPENIHVNAFMYEPIIDLSDWHLKKLYEDIKSLSA